jgi:hypothetical protein
MPGPHDFAVRSDLTNASTSHVLPAKICEGVEAPFVCAPVSLTAKPALRSICAPTLPRPPHPSRVRDDREAPLLPGKDEGELIELICPTAKAKYFERLDRFC